MGNVGLSRDDVLARAARLDRDARVLIEDIGDVHRVMGHGFWLRVPHDGTQATLRHIYPDPGGTYFSYDPVAVPDSLLPKLLGSEAGYAFCLSQLGKLDRERAKQRAVCERSGVEIAAEIDGGVADWYCLVQ